MDTVNSFFSVKKKQKPNVHVALSRLKRAWIQASENKKNQMESLWRKSYVEFTL